MKSKDITPKTTISGGVRQPRVAPPVYRPQPLPKVLQRKVHHHVTPVPPAANPNQSIQRKAIQPNVNVHSPRPNTVVQRKATTTPGPYTPPKRPLGPRSQVAQLTQHVRVPRSQTLLKDAPGGKLTGTSFAWSSNFDVDIIGHKVVVTVRVKAAISADLFERVWRRSVAEKWNKKFMIQANGENYPIEVNLEHVPAAEHYTITVRAEAKVSGSGSRGHFGTESMTVWGENDVFNVAHEVGHMLGNVDEYGVVKLSATDIRDYLTTPSTGIMHRPEFDPLAHNYYLIAYYAKLEMIDKGLIKSSDTVEIKPDVGARHGYGGGGPGGPSHDAVRSALGSLKPRGAAAAAASATTTTTSPVDNDLAEALARRRAAIATPPTTTTTTTATASATTTTTALPPRPLPPRPTPPTATTPTTPTTPTTTPATITSPSLAAIAAAPKPTARAIASTPTTTVASTPSASPSTPPSASASAAKPASASVKRAARPPVTPPPPIPQIRFHYARVIFINDYLLNYFDFLTQEQIAFFTAHPWRTDTTISEKGMALLAKGHK